MECPVAKFDWPLTTNPLLSGEDAQGLVVVECEVYENKNENWENRSAAEWLTE